MTVRLTPRAHPERTLVIGGIYQPVQCRDSILDGTPVFTLVDNNGIPQSFYNIAAIELDDAPGDFW